jgi:hypothetical protein
MSISGSDGGWISGGMSWYDKHVDRKDKFLAVHPEWSIAYVRSMDQHEASTGSTDTELVIMQDKSLGTLMDRLEARYPEEKESGEASD